MMIKTYDVAWGVTNVNDDEFTEILHETVQAETPDTALYLTSFAERVFGELRVYTTSLDSEATGGIIRQNLVGSYYANPYQPWMLRKRRANP